MLHITLYGARWVGSTHLFPTLLAISNKANAVLVLLWMPTEVGVVQRSVFQPTSVHPSRTSMLLSRTVSTARDPSPGVPFRRRDVLTNQEIVSATGR